MGFNLDAWLATITGLNFVPETDKQYRVKDQPKQLMAGVDWIPNNTVKMEVKLRDLASIHNCTTIYYSKSDYVAEFYIKDLDAQMLKDHKEKWGSDAQ